MQVNILSYQNLAGLVMQTNSCLSTIDLLLLAVSYRKRVGFSMIFHCKNRFGFRSELAKSKKSNGHGSANLFTKPANRLEKLFLEPESDYFHYFSDSEQQRRVN